MAPPAKPATGAQRALTHAGRDIPSRSEYSAVREQENSERQQRRLRGSITSSVTPSTAPASETRRHPLQLAASASREKRAAERERRGYVEQHAHRQHEIEREKIRQHGHREQRRAERGDAEDDVGAGDAAAATR